MAGMYLIMAVILMLLITIAKFVREEFFSYGFCKR